MCLSGLKRNKKFQRYQRGSLIPVFAIGLSLTSLLGAGVSSMGFKMDAQQRLDQALQHATLAITRMCERYKVIEGESSCPVNTFLPNIEQQIAYYYGAAWGQEVKIQQLTAVEQNDGSYRVTASIEVEGLFGISALDNVSATQSAITYRPAVPDGLPVEIALVVDNSGSMATSFDGLQAIEHLRIAMDSFIDRLPSSGGRLQNVRLSVIPFTQIVAFHPDGEDILIEPPLDGSTSPLSRRCYEGDPESFQYTRPIWERLMLSPWSSSGDVEFPDTLETFGIFGDCEDQMQAHYLTDDLSFIRQNLELMEASGATSIELGVAWGWRALDPRWRIDRPSDSYAANFGDSKKIIVIFSDAEGISTVPLAMAGVDDGSHLDSLCGSMKAREIEVFTVRLGTSGGRALELCATDLDHYQLVADPGDIVETFNDALGSVNGSASGGFSY